MITASGDAYGDWLPVLETVQTDLVHQIEKYNQVEKQRSGEMAYEHLIYRIKSVDSMEEKCRRKGLPVNAHSALVELRDAIGLRIVCRFLHDIKLNIDYIKQIPGCKVIQEKDYIHNVKPNGYRSYHMILELEEPFRDVDGNQPGKFYAEIQLRTIAMDSWASLEHQMKYKHHIKNAAVIGQELKRCADELAACDLAMQTIRNLLQEEPEGEEENQ